MPYPDVLRNVFSGPMRLWNNRLPEATARVPEDYLKVSLLEPRSAECFSTVRHIYEHTVCPSHLDYQRRKEQTLHPDSVLDIVLVTGVKWKKCIAALSCSLCSGLLN
jgi:hypothetical protein